MAKRTYDQVKTLVERLGGTTDYEPGGGGGGGVHVLRLLGKTLRVPAPTTQVNMLDALYVAPVESPRYWEDYGPNYGEGAPPVENWEWKLLGLIGLLGKEEA